MVEAERNFNMKCTFIINYPHPMEEVLLMVYLSSIYSTGNWNLCLGVRGNSKFSNFRIPTSEVKYKLKMTFSVSRFWKEGGAESAGVLKSTSDVLGDT